MRPGDRVVIQSGFESGREGVVAHVAPSISGCGRVVVHVRLRTPVLFMDPDGPTREVVLPYAPAELRSV